MVGRGALPPSPKNITLILGPLPGFLLVVTILFQAADAFEKAVSELTLNPALDVTDVAHMFGEHKSRLFWFMPEVCSRPPYLIP